jgi:hypothetical protein
MLPHFAFDVCLTQLEQGSTSAGVLFGHVISAFKQGMELSGYN